MQVDVIIHSCHDTKGKPHLFPLIILQWSAQKLSSSDHRTLPTKLKFPIFLSSLLYSSLTIYNVNIFKKV